MRLAVPLILLLATTAAFAAPKAPKRQTIDTGVFRIEANLHPEWRWEIAADKQYAIFRFDDGISRATIGVFQLTCPAELRGADPHTLAVAYAGEDGAGVQKALFKSRVKLVSKQKKPAMTDAGMIFHFQEEIDVRHARISSTKFNMAAVLFPATFSSDGIFYLAVGREESDQPARHAYELGALSDLIAGTRGISAGK